MSVVDDERRAKMHWSHHHELVQFVLRRYHVFVCVCVCAYVCVRRCTCKCICIYACVSVYARTFLVSICAKVYPKNLPFLLSQNGRTRTEEAGRQEPCKKCAYHAQSFTGDGLRAVFLVRMIHIFRTNVHVQVFDFEYFCGGERGQFPFLILICLFVR